MATVTASKVRKQPARITPKAAVHETRKGAKPRHLQPHQQALMRVKDGKATQIPAWHIELAVTQKAKWGKMLKILFV